MTNLVADAAFRGATIAIDIAITIAIWTAIAFGIRAIVRAVRNARHPLDAGRAFYVRVRDDDGKYLAVDQAGEKAAHFNTWSQASRRAKKLGRYGQATQVVMLRPDEASGTRTSTTASDGGPTRPQSELRAGAVSSSSSALRAALTPAFCSQCGSEIESGSRFCASCGHALTVDSDDGVPEHTRRSVHQAQPSKAEPLDESGRVAAATKITMQVERPSSVDIAAFYEADRRRRTSEELKFGMNWRARDEKGGWSVFWIRDTGELAAMQNGVPAPTFGEGPILVDLMGAAVPGVAVLLIEPDEDALQRRLNGWEVHHGDPDGLGWLRRAVEAP